MYQKIFELHAELLKALAHPRRLEIIHLLRNQALDVSDMYAMLDLPQANVSQHLQVLRQAGVVHTKKHGKHVIYRLAHKNFIKTCDLMRSILIERFEHHKLHNELSLSMKQLVPVVKDPVCGMRVSPKTAGFTQTHKKNTYYFCASGCHQKFIKNPGEYI